jgi:hypothetical protein
MKHVERAPSDIGMIAVEGPDCQEGMYPGSTYNQRELAYTLSDKRKRERIYLVHAIECLGYNFDHPPHRKVHSLGGGKGGGRSGYM